MNKAIKLYNKAKKTLHVKDSKPGSLIIANRIKLQKLNAKKETSKKSLTKKQIAIRGLI